MTTDQGRAGEDGARIVRPACRISVEVNLDGVPGWGYEADDFRALVERAVMESVPHYKPVVTVECERFNRDQ